MSGASWSALLTRSIPSLEAAPKALLAPAAGGRPLASAALRRLLLRHRLGATGSPKDELGAPVAAGLDGETAEGNSLGKTNASLLRVRPDQFVAIGSVV